LNHRNFSLAASAAALLLPVICLASPETKALDACVKAFATRVEPGIKSSAVKIHYASDRTWSPLSDYYSRDFTFFLQLRDPKSGKYLSAKCSADRNGAAVDLSPTPMIDAKPLTAKAD
jgi:hypothetical protein